MAERLTPADADALYNARLILTRLAEEAARASYSDAVSLGDAGRLGRFAQACASAEDAVFDVINVASSYLDDANAAASHQRWMARNEDVTA